MSKYRYYDIVHAAGYDRVGQTKGTKLEHDVLNGVFAELMDQVIQIYICGEDTFPKKSHAAVKWTWEVILKISKVMVAYYRKRS